VSFGRPETLHQEIDAIARELHLLRAQVKVLELQMQAEAELAPIEA
jgi:hypothetical protein